LPPVDELRESLLQTVDVLRSYLHSTERTIGGVHEETTAAAGCDLATIYRALEVEADTSPGLEGARGQSFLIGAFISGVGLLREPFAVERAGTRLPPTRRIMIR
jgi:hypothetical protein